MSSPIPARGCPAAFSQKESLQVVLRNFSATPKLAAVTPASRLEVRPAPELVSSGIREINALTGGLPRGCLIEVCGPASSGRTSVLLAGLAAATQRQEACALVDAGDALHPQSASGAGVDFERLLWVRCGEDAPRKNSPRKRASSSSWSFDEFRREKNEGPVEQALRITDLLLQSGGFGMIAVDLGDVPQQVARRIPLTSWFRFQRTVENTPTILFVIAPAPCAPACAALLLQLRPAEAGGQGDFSFSPAKKAPSHAQLLEGIRVEGELLRSRMQRKPAGSVMTAFATRAVKAG